MPGGVLRPEVTSYRSAVDFENPGEIVSAVEEIYRDLKSEGMRDSDVIVDVTGGQKTTTAAATAVSLDRRRRFQYVSLNDYRVRSFDLRYEPDYGTAE
jgi:hypothetical protein